MVARLSQVFADIPSFMFTEKYSPLIWTNCMLFCVSGSKRKRFWTLIALTIDKPVLMNARVFDKTLPESY